MTKYSVEKPQSFLKILYKLGDDKMCTYIESICEYWIKQTEHMCINPLICFKNLFKQKIYSKKR